MGVHELGLRKSILKNVENFRTSKRASESVQKEAEASPSHVNMDKFRNTVTNSL